MKRCNQSRLQRFFALRSAFSCLTRPDRVKAFVLDDSVMSRNRNKSVELLANTYDHVFHVFVKGFKRRCEAVSKKSGAAVQLIRSALNCGIKTDYVLMDTWFTNEPMIKAVLKEGLDVGKSIRTWIDPFFGGDSTYAGINYTCAKKLVI